MGLPTETDFVVVGAGIAGLRAAITLAESGRVLVLTKESLGESNTSYAQGGIAVAMGGEEDVALHLEDTVQAGDGLVDRAAARDPGGRGSEAGRGAVELGYRLRSAKRLRWIRRVDVDSRGRSQPADEFCTLTATRPERRSAARCWQRRNRFPKIDLAPVDYLC